MAKKNMLPASAKLPVKTASGKSAADELHDGACQTLTGARFLAQTLSNSLERQNSDDAPAVKELSKLLKQASLEMGQVVARLRLRNVCARKEK